MSILSYFALVDLIKDGVINADLSQVNGASIDLSLHNLIKTESSLGLSNPPVDLYPVDGSPKQSILMMDDLDISKNDYPVLKVFSGYILRPDEFILGSTNEVFNLPDNISCEYKLKSTQARNAMDHLNAGWADAGWHGSRLTLELKNVSRYHRLILRPNMPIGQMVFFEHEPVPKHASYAVKGQYNNQKCVTESKGIR
ncbi:MAG: hypothetical protein WC856_02660 [Methylococcaceae bacterium]|jgi:dCTP deaminase